MPGPVSTTESMTLGPRPSPSSVTRPPGGVNLTALSSRLTRICSSARRSALARSRSGTSASSAIFFSDARSRNSSTTRAQSGANCTGPSAGFHAPVSSLDRSSRSSVSRVRRSAWRAIISTKLRACPGSSRPPSSSVSAAPRMAVTGVRSSCEALAMKSRRTRSARRSAVRSRSTNRARACERGATCASTCRSSEVSAISRRCGQPASPRAHSSTSSELRVASSTVGAAPSSCSMRGLRAAIRPPTSSSAAASGIASSNS